MSISQMGGALRPQERRSTELAPGATSWNTRYVPKPVTYFLCHAHWPRPRILGPPKLLACGSCPSSKLLLPPCHPSLQKENSRIQSRCSKRGGTADVRGSQWLCPYPCASVYFSEDLARGLFRSWGQVLAQISTVGEWGRTIFNFF